MCELLAAGIPHFEDAATSNDLVAVAMPAATTNMLAMEESRDSFGFPSDEEAATRAFYSAEASRDRQVHDPSMPCAFTPQWHEHTQRIIAEREEAKRRRDDANREFTARFRGGRRRRNNNNGEAESDEDSAPPPARRARRGRGRGRGGGAADRPRRSSPSPPPPPPADESPPQTANVATPLPPATPTLIKVPPPWSGKGEPPAASLTDPKCVVCAENAQTACILPCRHGTTCYTCIRKIIQLAWSKHNPRSRRNAAAPKPALCPLCNAPIEDVIRIYR